jgi:hypothetical protein
MGSLQARMTQGDSRLYNVNRDVAHNFDYVIMEVSKCVETGRWDALVALAKEKKISDEELGKVCQALCRFVVVQTDNPKESMASCLARCGFLGLNATARIIVMAYLGIVTLGMHHAGVREATLNKEGPALTYKQLRWHGAKLVLLMKMSKLRRRFYCLKQRIRRAWRTFWEKSEYDG